jgi:hypothetical protein
MAVVCISTSCRYQPVVHEYRRGDKKKQESQKEPKKPGVAVIEPEPQVASNYPRSRSSRTIKKTSHLHDFRVDSFADVVFDSSILRLRLETLSVG